MNSSRSNRQPEEKVPELLSGGIETNKEKSLFKNLRGKNEKRERLLLLLRSDLCVTEAKDGNSLNG